MCQSARPFSKDAGYTSDQSSRTSATNITQQVKDLLLAVPGALSSALFPPPPAEHPKSQKGHSSQQQRQRPMVQVAQEPDSSSFQHRPWQQQDTFQVDGLQVPVTYTKPEEPIAKLASPSFRTPSLQDPLSDAACLYYLQLPPNSPQDVLRNAGEVLGALRQRHSTSPLNTPLASPQQSHLATLAAKAWLAAERDEGLGSERSAATVASGSSSSCSTSPSGDAGESVLYETDAVSPAAALLPGCDVRLLRLAQPAEGGSIAGEVAVRPGGHTREVAVRYTLDNWASYREVVAKWQGLVDNKGANRYVFAINVATAITAGAVARHMPDDGEGDLECAVRLARLGSSHVEWDNNGGANYRVRIRL